MNKETYLGDGLYVSFDGWQFCLRAPRSDGDHEVPERREVIDFRKLRMDQLWRKRQILDNTYLRSLLILGYRPDEANTELRLLKMEGK